jgi:cytochrome P450
VLYSNSAKLDKDPWFYGFVGVDEAGFSTSNYEAHRVKRSKVNPFFSKASVERSEPLLQKVLRNMLAGFDERKSSGEPVGLRNALKSFAADIVCEFCFPESMEYVKASDFSASFHKGQEGFAHMLPWFRHVPGLATFIMSTPDFMVPYFPKETQDAMSFLKVWCILPIVVQREEISY